MVEKLQSTRRSQFPNTLAKAVLAAATAAVLAPVLSPAHAENKSWTGDSLIDDNFSSGANWNNTTPPINGDALFFAGTDRLTPLNDILGGPLYTGITFNADAGAFTLSGASINLNGGIGNNSAILQTIALPLVLNSTTNVGGTGNIEISGNITGGLGLTKSTASTVILSGTNTLASVLTFGGSNVDRGAFRIASNGALGGVTTIASNGQNNGQSRIELVNDVNVGSGITMNINGREPVAVPQGAGAALVNISGNNTWAGTLNASGSGGTGYGVRSDAGTLTLTGPLQVTLPSTRIWHVGGAGNIVLGGALAQVGGAGSQLALTKHGTGNVYVNSTSNTYSGTVTINGGLLSVPMLTNTGVASALGTHGTIVLSGGGLQYTGAGHSTNRTMSIGTAGGTFDASGTGSMQLAGSFVPSGVSGSQTITLAGSSAGSVANNLSGPISNGGGTNITHLAKTGPNLWVVNGTHTYTGSTNVNEGTLKLLSTSTLASPTLSTSTGGVLDVTDFGTYNLPSGKTIAGAGSVSGPVAANLGSSIRPGTNSATPGTLTFNNGLSLNNATVNFDIVAGVSDQLRVTGGALSTVGTSTISIASSDLGVGVYTLIDYEGAIGGSGFPALTLGQLPGHAVGNIINNAGNTSVDLNITLIDTIKWAGPGSDWDINTSPNWVLNSNASSTVFYQSDIVTFDDTASNFNVNLANVALMPNSITVNNTNNAYVWAGTGSISGTTGLTKNGTNRLTIANAGVNNFAGTVTINAGTLQVGDGGTAGNLPAGATVVNNGALHYFLSAASTINQVISGTGSLVIQNGAVISGNNTFDGITQILSGSVAPTSASAFGSTAGGTVLEAGSQIYVTVPAGLNFGAEPLTLNGATLRTGGNGSFNFGGPVTVTGASTFNNDGGSQAVIAGAYSSSSDLDKIGGGTTTLTGMSTFNDAYISAGVLTIAGPATFNNANISAGRMIIAANATYVDAYATGVLQIGNGGVLGNLGSGVVDNLGGVEFNRTDTYAVPASSILNVGTVTNTGTGTTILSGDNSFLTGVLRATNGVLQLEAGILGSGQIITEAAGSVQIRDAGAVASIGSVNIIGNNAQTGGLQVGNNVTDLLSGKTINLNARGNLTPGIISMDGNNSIAANVVLQAGGQDYTIQANAATSLVMKGTLTSAAVGSERRVRLQGDGVGTFSGLISTGTAGSLTVNKLGAGTWTLNAANTYNGNTIATGGTLVLVGAAKNPVINSGRFGISNGGAIVLDYNDTGNTGTWGAEIVNDLPPNEATGFIASKIRTTLAQNNTRAIGWEDDTTAKLFTVRYTHKGDINLDGAVDSFDFNAFVTGYGKTSGGIWADGNFDYNDGGKVNTLDFNYLAGNFGAGPISAVLPGDVLGGGVPSATLGAVVPEPAALSVLALGAMGLIGRRRRDVR